MCELAFNAAEERQGTGIVCVNPALSSRQQHVFVPYEHATFLVSADDLQ
jgi:hypothetical protein